MKNVFLFSLITVFIVSCSGQQEKELSSTSAPKEETVATTPSKPLLTFASNSYDFGTATEGTIINHTYQFVNTSDQVVKITRANASCGCTVPSFPKEPIQPGEKGNIDVEFNSTGKNGLQQKMIRVFTDGTDQPIRLQLSGTIE